MTPTQALDRAHFHGVTEFPAPYTLYSTWWLCKHFDDLPAIQSSYSHIDPDSAPFYLYNCYELTLRPIWDDTHNTLCALCGV